MKKAFIFIFFLIATSRGQDINCQDKAFELKLAQTIPITVNQLSVTIHLSMNVKTGVLPVGVTEVQYAKSCISKIRFEVNSASGFKLSQNSDLPDNLNLQSMFFDITPLDPLTQYNVDVSYIQTRPTTDPVPAFSQTINSCFDNPSVPRNLKLDIKTDESGTLTWTAPEKLNSPKICYYSVYKRTNPGTEKELAKIEDNVLRLDISKEDISSSTFIGVNAVNDKSCYTEISFASTCKSPLGQNAEFQISPATTTQKPVTTTTPNQSTRLGLSFFLLFLLPLIAFIYDL